MEPSTYIKFAEPRHPWLIELVPPPFSSG